MASVHSDEAEKGKYNTDNIFLSPQTQDGNKSWFYNMGTSVQVNIQWLYSVDCSGKLS
jgi:hypothetical protein